MRRTLLAALGGAALGAGATFVVMHDRESPADESTVALPGLAASPSGMSLSSELPTAERLALYEKAVNASVPELREMLAENARRASTPAERFALEAAFARYTELDARGAATAADELGLDPALAARAYVAWAIMDSAAALRALGRMSDEARARAIAHAIAPVVARRDPKETFASARHINRASLEAIFESAAAQAWAASAPDEMLDYFATLPNARLEALLSAQDYAGAGPADAAPRMDVIAALARANPSRLLEIADRLSASLAETVRRMGIAELAERDPLAAIEHVERAAMDSERRRQELAAIAPTFGRRDPAAAVAWARASGDPELLVQVLTAVAAVDPLLALDAALGETAPAARARLLQSVSASIWNADSAQLRAVAERMLVEPNVETHIVTSVVGRWSSVDPFAAIDWLVAQGERAGAEAFRIAAAYASQRDLDAAAAYTSRIPDSMRPAWLAQVATAYAAQDPMGAARWLEQFRGLRGYEEAVAAAAPSVASRNPVAAADLLSRIDASSPRFFGAVVSVATAWSAQDPAAAAAWAYGLGETARQTALPSVLSMWAQQAPHEARGFALSMPRGEERDRVLHTLVAATSHSDGNLDSALLNAFSNDFARQNAVIQAALVKARQDPAAAQALLDTHVSDPNLKARAEEMLTRFPAVEPSVVATPQGVVLRGRRLEAELPPSLGFAAPPAIEGARIITSEPVAFGPVVMGPLQVPPNVVRAARPPQPEPPPER